MSKVHHYLVYSDKELCKKLDEADVKGTPFAVDVDKWMNCMAFKINLNDEDEGFLQVKETLTRLGIPKAGLGGEKRTLYQTCHILKKKDAYYIVHFKELLLLDGKKVNMTWSDLKRRAEIIRRLKSWNLISYPDNQEKCLANVKDESVVSVKVIKHSEKDQWNLVVKYNIGGKKGFSKQDNNG